MSKPDVICFVIILFLVGCIVGIVMAHVVNPSIANGTTSMGQATVHLPSGDFTYEGKATYKYGSDGSLLWCRVEPWPSATKEK